MHDYLKVLKIPVIKNFPHGHVKENITFPFGTEVKMNMKKVLLNSWKTVLNN
jgi:muramoyltetrapeptide carboxypeptidase LdcA involved in peptidoglycan recycling